MTGLQVTKTALVSIHPVTSRRPQSKPATRCKWLDPTEAQATLRRGSQDGKKHFNACIEKTCFEKEHQTSLGKKIQRRKQWCIFQLTKQSMKYWMRRSWFAQLGPFHNLVIYTCFEILAQAATNTVC